MSQLHLRKYNQAATINFNLFDLDGVDMSVAATFATGDLKIMKDEGAEANPGSLPTDEGSGYSLALTATEMTAARIMIHLIDQTATKVWLDTSIVIETYGHASASHAFDLDTANVTLAAATHTGAVIPTVTTLTNLPAITANWLTATGIAASALNGKGDWNIGKTGYSISGTKQTLDALNDVAATAIVSAGAITTLSGAIVNVDLVDTTTTNTDMRGTDSANTVVPDNTSIAAILVDTSTTLDTKINDMQGGTFSSATDSLEAIRNRGDAAWITGGGGASAVLLQNTTIATLASQTSFTLTAGSADNDAYNNALAVITDSVTAVQKAVATVSAYVGSTRTVTLAVDPAVFTMATGDTIDIVAAPKIVPTVTTLTNLPSIPANWLTATGIAASAMNGKGDWNINKTGYSISGTKQTLDALNDIAATTIVSSGAITTLAGAVVNVDLVDTTTTNTDMRGTDSAALASVATEGRLAELDAANIPATVDAILIDTADIQSRLPAALVGGLMSSDVTAISTDTVAADNLESQFDTTGLTGDTFPSTQAQLSSVANVGSAVHKAADSYTLTTGTQSANTVADTEALNAIRHTHTDTAGAIDYYYEFSIGSGIPASVQVSGYVNGGNDDIGIYGYDWVATAWVQIGTFFGKNNSNNEVNSYDLFIDMVGSGSNEGLVRVRFFTTSGLTTATVAVDQIFVAFNQGVEGYENAAVWYDSDAANTSTVVGIDGVSRNPVSTIAAVNTLLASTNLHRVQVSPGSSMTLAAAQVNQIFMGNDWTLALGGQDISGSYFEGATVSGTGTSPTGEVRFSGCDIQTVSIGEAHLGQCGFESGTVTLTAAGNYVFNQCYSHVAGTGTPIIDFGAALGNTNLSMASYSNGIQIDNLNAAGADNFSISGHGQIIYAASSSGTVNQRGMWKVTNTGGLTITTDDNTTDLNAVLVDTNEIQADWTNGGRLDLLLDALITQIDTAASEPGQGAPPVSAKMALKIDYLYKWTRNRATSTATTINHYADDGTTIDQKATHSDDGTTYDRTEVVSGP